MSLDGGRNKTDVGKKKTSTGTNGHGSDDESANEDDEADEPSSSSALRLLTKSDGDENDVISGAPLHQILEESDDSDAYTPLPEALDKFRCEWKEELQKQATAQTSGRVLTSTPERSGSESLKSSRGVSPAKDQIVPLGPKEQQSCYGGEEEIFEKAKSLFLRGAEHEQKGQMQDAIRCYTQSVHLVSDIEKRVYSASVKGHGGRVGSSQSSSISTSRCSTPADDISSSHDLLTLFSRRIYDNGKQKACRRSQLAGSEEIHISDLPIEVVMQIFRWVVSSELDLRQLEQLTEVCAGFFVLGRSPELWRSACLNTWGVRLGILDENYPTWRDMYILRPHVWHNGVYISKVTYVSLGEAAFQDRFYRPWRLIIYYRYLRFYADGSVAMLTTAEEPETVVPNLRCRSPRYQGVMTGKYRLVGKDCISAYLTRTKKNYNENYLIYPYTRKKGHISPYEPVEHAFGLIDDGASERL